MRGIHSQSDDETQEWASLRALGLLTPEEQADYDNHRSGCSICQGEFRSFNDLASLIALGPEPQSPSDKLRERVMAVIQPVTLNANGLLIANSEAIPWQPTGIPGCWHRLLFVDRARGYHTSMVRLEPGSFYPSHQHAELEELFLLEGDVTVEGQILRPGAYCRAEGGSLHGDIHTRSGCRFLVVASLSDKILPRK